MSPKVEQLRPIEGLKETNCFTIELLSKDGEFDLNFFDDQVKKLAGFDDFGRAKFIVVGDTMLVFPEFQLHSTIHAFASKVGVVGELQCAGKISFNFTGKNQDEVGPTRRIYDSSSTLYQKLPPAKSEEYKQTVLKEKLGEHFTIE